MLQIIHIEALRVAIAWRHGSGWVLVLQIAPATDTTDIGTHTLH